MQQLKTLLQNKRVWLGVVGVGVLILAVLQVVPIKKDNPPVVQEPAWDSDATRALAKTACFDCHSNETVWPWYADVAPMRVLVRQHVLEGRDHLNFSDMGGRVDVGELEEVIQEGEMPPWDYVLLHPDAKLSDEDKATLIDGFYRTFGAQGETNMGR